MTPLSERSFNARISFAYIVDAFENFADCNPGSTWERIQTNMDEWTTVHAKQNRSGAPVLPSEEQYKKHAYSAMWLKIEKYYASFTFDGVKASELSSSEFLGYVRAALTKGATYGSKSVSGADVIASAALWSKRGWFRYEEKRAGKLKIVKKVAFFSGLLAVGPVLGAFGALGGAAGEAVASVVTDTVSS